MQHPIDIGTVANDGTGDTLRVAFEKLNTDLAELFAWTIGGGGSDSAAQILAKLLTVDGSGSGLDADLFDGLNSSAFALDGHTHPQSDVTGLAASLAAKLDASAYTAADVLAKLLTVDGPSSGINADLLDGLNSTAFAASVHVHLIADVTGLQTALDAQLTRASYTAADVLSKLLTVDGNGSGLDADLLDGQSSAAFAAASHAHAIADVTGLQTALDGKGDLSSNASVSVDSELAIFSGTTGKLLKRATGNGLATLAAGVLSLTDPATFAAASHTHAQGDITGLAASLAAKLDASAYTAADVLAKLLTVDGAGSGLDADTLDGQSSAAFAAASHTHAQSEVTGLEDALTAKLDASAYTAADVLSKLLTVDGSGSGLDADTLDGVSSAGFVAVGIYTAADVLSKLLTVDGSGSGLDADTLDGLSSASFLLASSYTAADVLTKLLTVDGSGSGLDADLLDGLSSAAFLQASTYEGLTPTWTQTHTFSDRIHVIAAPVPAGLAGAGAGTVMIGATTTGVLALFQYGATPHIDLYRTNGSS